VHHPSPKEEATGREKNVLSLPLTSVYETAAGLTLLPQESATLSNTVALRSATVAQTVVAQVDGSLDRCRQTPSNTAVF